MHSQKWDLRQSVQPANGDASTLEIYLGELLLACVKRITGGSNISHQRIVVVLIVFDFLRICYGNGAL